MFKSLKSILIGVVVLLFIVGILSFIDTGFALAVSMLFFLATATIWVFRKAGIQESHATALFILALIFHMMVASFIYFADFQPFSGGQGDYESYNQTAESISYFLSEGDLAIGGYFDRISHYYPLIIGVVYTALFPSMIIGQFFNVWLAAVSVLLLYLIAREIGVSKWWALGVGLLASIYPSFVFYTSLLLKDAVVIVLVLAALLLALRLMRTFSWSTLFLFALVLIWLTHFRFYMGIIVLGVFTVSWFLFSRMDIRKRFLYGLFIFPLLGFIPSVNEAGYYGIDRLVQYGNQDVVTFYKEEVYTPGYNTAPIKEIPSTLIPESIVSSPPLPEPASPPAVVLEDAVVDEVTGTSSTVDLDTSFDNPAAFIRTFSESFAFTSIGPFPWQLSTPRHYLVLIETVPWLVLMFFIVWGIIRSWKIDKRAFLLVLFAVGVFSLLAIFFSNFGVTTRIRIPAFLVLLPFIPFVFQKFKKGEYAQ